MLHTTFKGMTHPQEDMHSNITCSTATPQKLSTHLLKLQVWVLMSLLPHITRADRLLQCLFIAMEISVEAKHIWQPDVLDLTIFLIHKLDNLLQGLQV